MRKILVVILFFISLSGFSQRFSGGVLLGFNASQVDGDTYAGYNKLGLCFGGYVYTALTDMVDLQLEIKYMGKGARNNPSKNSYGLYVNQLNYIELPVVFRFKTGSRIDLEGGIAAGYLFNNTMKDDYGSAEITGLFKSTDISALVGIRYKVISNLSMVMRASYSLSTIREDLKAYSYLRGTGVYNNVLTIALFYDIYSKAGR